MDYQQLHDITLSALRFLSARCDGAHEKDSVGFNGGDSAFGKKLATLPALSQQQVQEALRMLPKYHGQLQTAGIEIPPTEAVKPILTERAKAERKVTLLPDSKIQFSFPYDKDLIARIKAIPGGKGF